MNKNNLLEYVSSLTREELDKVMMDQFTSNLRRWTRKGRNYNDWMDSMVYYFESLKEKTNF